MEKLVDLPFDQTVHAVSYADDIAILAADGHGEEWQSHIQQALVLMNSACTYWGLKISLAKSRVLQLRRGLQDVPVSVQGTVLQTTNTYRYLGMVIDKTFNFDAHIKDLETRVAKRLNIARYISSRRCGAGPNMLRAYYVAAIRSVLEYGSIALICAAQTSLKKREGLQNHAMRTITRAPIWTNKSTLHMELNLPPLHVRRKQLLLTASDNFLRQDLHPANLRLRYIL